MPLRFGRRFAVNILNATRRPPDLPVTFGAFVHVPLIFFSYAAIANAFGIRLAFVIGERQIKSKRPNALSYRLPPLEEMDRIIARLVAAAFPALTVGLLLGLRWARLAYGTTWAWDAKVLWSVAIWAVYGFSLAVRYGLGWRGRRTAYLSLAGFGGGAVQLTAAQFLFQIPRFRHGKARMKRLRLVGVSHRTAPVEWRERLAVPDDRLPALVERLRPRGGGGGGGPPDLQPGRGVRRDRSRRRRPVARRSGPGMATPAWPKPFYQHDDDAAVRHLFRVAAGLDSLVIGEAEILGQVRRAYDLAKQAGATGKLTNVLFQRAM
ncbi:MAG: cytochrome c biogenesis protein CcsA [Elusimicrobia bacterium]|nr:cytochrome c biogenesis protein CcsA [Elusimicrobiota bacterium]